MMYGIEYFEILGDAMDEVNAEIAEKIRKEEEEEAILDMLFFDGFFDEPEPTEEDVELMYLEYIQFHPEYLEK